jgi:adiponectin receptor
LSGRNFPLHGTVGDQAIFFVFFICAQCCFLFSTLFHIHFCHSRWAFVKFGCLDYAGISSMICGSCCVVTYFAFYCEPAYRNIYLTFTVMCASVGILGPFKEKWAHRSFRKWRTLIYVASAVSSALPLLHYLIAHGFPTSIRYTFYQGVFLMAFLYLFGAFIYTTRIPERFYPGRFDIYFHSHQWWHVCVVLAWYVHYNTALKLMEWRVGPEACRTS